MYFSHFLFRSLIAYRKLDVASHGWLYEWVAMALLNYVRVCKKAFKGFDKIIYLKDIIAWFKTLLSKKNLLKFLSEKVFRNYTDVDSIEFLFQMCVDFNALLAVELFSFCMDDDRYVVSWYLRFYFTQVRYDEP